MTSRLYTREEMVESWTAGANGWHTTFDRHEQAQKEEDAEKYVDALKNATSAPEVAAPVDLIPENVSWPTWGDLAALEVKFNEFVLKTKERELALARIVGAFIAKAPFYFDQLDYQEDRYMSQLTEWIGQLNTHFPELSSQEEL